MDAVCGFVLCLSLTIWPSPPRGKDKRQNHENQDKKHAESQDIPSGRSSNPLSAMVADVVGIEITGKEHRDLNET